MTFDDLVSDFLKEYGPFDELAEYATYSLDDAIENAAFAIVRGQKHSRQFGIPQEVFNTAAKKLHSLKAEISRCTSFHALYTLLATKLKDIKRISLLYYYDTATRIGRNLGLAPEYVYINSGSKEGAGYLGISRDYAKLDEFPAPFRRLTAMQVGDFLSIYKLAIGQVAEGGVPVDLPKRFCSLAADEVAAGRPD